MALRRRAREYALPRDLGRRLGLRRYGFHGTSHAFVAQVAAQWLGEPLERLRSGLGVAEVDRLLNHQTGLVGLAGTTDMREVERRAGGARRSYCGGADLRAVRGRL